MTQPTEAQTNIVERLLDEADLCQNEGAEDIATLLSEAAAEITRLRTELAEARLQGRREGLEATQEVLGRIAYAIIEGSGGARAADHAREFVTANWEDAVRSAHNVLTELRAIDPATLMKDADEVEIPATTGA